MNLLSKVSYYKIHVLTTISDIRIILNDLGLVSERWTEKKNKEDAAKVVACLRNLNAKDMLKIFKQNAKHFHEGVKGGLEK